MMKRSACRLCLWTAPLFCVPFAATPRPAAGLTINLVQNFDIASASDPGGVKLAGIMSAAADYWEGIIKNAHTLTITYGYAVVTDPTKAAFTAVGAGDLAANGRALTAGIGFKSAAIQWYYDPTPTNNSEFDLSQVLYGDLTLPQKNFSFKGTPPALWEIGYLGDARPSAPAAAQTGVDAFSVAVHEIGHALGTIFAVSSDQTSDSDYDINPDFIFGATAAARVFSDNSGTDREHLQYPNSLMSPTVPVGGRVLPSALDVMAIAAGPDTPWTIIDLPRKDFLGGTNWHTAANWEGRRVPDSQDDAAVRIGDAIVSLAANARVENLLVSNRSRLVTFDNRLTVDSATTVQHDGAATPPFIIVSAGGELDTNDLNLNGGELRLVDGGFADIQDDLTIRTTLGVAGRVTGNGAILIDGDLTNGGVIRPDDGTLTITSTAALPALNLDGIAGVGQVDATAGNLTVNGELLGTFDGVITVGFGHSVQFNNGWELGPSGQLNLQGFPATPGIISGTHSTIDGPVAVLGVGRMATATTDFENNADVVVAVLSTLNLDTDTTFEGGSYTGLGTIRQLGDAIVNAPTVIAVNRYDADGDENPAQMLHVNADLTLNVQELDAPELGKFGVNRFDASVVVESGATLAVNTPDAWTANGGITLGTHGMGPAVISGSPVNIGNGAIPVSLVVHGTGELAAETRFQADTFVALPNATDTLNVTAPATFNGGTYGGNGLLALHDDVEISANTTINTDQVDLDGKINGDHHLRIAAGRTLTLNSHAIDTDGQHDDTIELRAGSHLVVNTLAPWRLGSDGQLILQDAPGGPASVEGQNLINAGRVSGNGHFEVSLSNQGTVAPGLSAGMIEIDGNYGHSLQGRLEIEIGGTVPAKEYDRVTVTQDARLAGTLDVALINGFTPDYGDVFTVLTADEIIGDFDTVIIEGQTPGKFQLGATNFALVPLLELDPVGTDTLSLVTTALGDLNLDGTVNIGDFLIFQNNFNDSGDWFDGDFNGDGLVNIGDFLLLQNNFNDVFFIPSGAAADPASSSGAGGTSGGGLALLADFAAAHGIAQTPEPTSMALLLLGGGIPVLARRRR